MWSKEIIPYLPNAQLKALRYEIGDMIKQYPNIKHGLVKYINNSHPMFLAHRFHDVLLEFDKRNIKHNKSYDDKIRKIILSKLDKKEHDYEINAAQIQRDRFFFCNYDTFSWEFNKRCLRQELYNLEEKAMKGLMTKEEWMKIYDKFKNKFDLWNPEKEKLDFYLKRRN
jgi:hypothetical protein